MAARSRARAPRPAQAQERVPAADLDERDPDYIRESLPGLWMLASFYFRAEVRGLENIPAEGPVLLVGNHSGGNLTPGHARLHARLQHLLRRRAALLPAGPQPRAGHAGPRLAAQVRHGRGARPRTRSKALDIGAALLVYPGGDYEVHRPTWESAKVDFGGRKGFIRLALEQDVPIVPGGVDRRPGDGAVPQRAASGSPGCCALDRLFRLKVLPISLALPWGLNVGDMLGHFPLPAKITIQVLRADRPARGVRPRPRPRRGLRRRHRADAAGPRRARGGAPAAGDRLMRVEQRHRRSTPRRRRSGSSSRPAQLPALHGRASPASRREGEQERGLGARYSMRMQVGLGGGRRPDRGRRVRRGRATWPGPASPGSTSAGAGALREQDDGAHEGHAAAELRRARAGCWRALTDRLSAPHGRATTSRSRWTKLELESWRGEDAVSDDEAQGLLGDGGVQAAAARRCWSTRA